MLEEKLDLQSLLNISNESKYTGNEITEERILAQLDNIRTLIAFYREYPYQRVILRIMMRHRYTYVVLPRGSSKSFLTMMILMLRCILYPGAEMFVTTGGEFILAYC